MALLVSLTRSSPSPNPACRQRLDAVQDASALLRGLLDLVVPTVPRLGWRWTISKQVTDAAPWWLRQPHAVREPRSETPGRPTMSQLFPTPPGPVSVASRTPSRTTSVGDSRDPPLATSSGVAGTGTPPASAASSAAPAPGLGHLEPLAQQHRQVVLDQLRQLRGIGEMLIRDATGIPVPGQHLAQPRLTVRRRRLDVDQPGQASRQPVLILQPGHILARRDPAGWPGAVGLSSCLAHLVFTAWGP
jgi:hypothetical protein